MNKSIETLLLAIGLQISIYSVCDMAVALFGCYLNMRQCIPVLHRYTHTKLKQPPPLSLLLMVSDFLWFQASAHGACLLFFFLAKVRSGVRKSGIPPHPPTLARRYV